MANERRLIDATALIGRTKEFCDENEVEWTTNKVLVWIDHAPTVDAIIPVRCRDCVHGKTWKNAWGCSGFKCDLFCVDLNPDDFCSYGERKSGTQPQREDV